MTPALPDNTGYVAAAYLVFLALILIYVVIMAAKLARHERDVAELLEIAERSRERDGDRTGEPEREREIA
jgi:TRAP-type C4-dicarboxylate transport system permease small subunit